MRHDLRLTSRHRGRESDSPIHELVMSQLCLPAATVFTSPMTTGRVVRACASFSSASGRDLSSQTWIRVPVVRVAIAALGSKPVTHNSPHSKCTFEITGLLE